MRHLQVSSGAMSGSTITWSATTRRRSAGPAQPAADGLRGGQLHRLPRRDGATRVLARAAALAALRRQGKEVPSRGRPRLASSRRPHEGLVNTTKEEHMTILRRCRGSCSNPRRCLDHLWFDVMYGGARYRMAANEFAVPRMEPGRQRPIESLEEARQWERLFIGEIEAGRDPRRPRKRRASHRRRHRGRLGVPRRLHGALRQAGGAEQPRRRCRAACRC